MALIAAGRSFAGAVLLIAIGAAAPRAHASDEEKDLGTRMNEVVLREALGQFWGMVLVARDGDVVLSQGYGYANRDLVPISGDSLFDVGSVSKQFTAAAVLRLVMDGKLSLEATLGELLKGAPPARANISVRQLLTHTSGLTDGVAFEPGDLETRDAMLQAVLRSPVAAEAGERFQYSNVGYFVLAALIELASEQTFEAYMKAEIFGRAGLTDTGFVGDVDLDRSGATARVMGRSTVSALEYNWNWGNKGATGVLTTANDLRRWDAALRTNGVLGDEELKAMFAPEDRGYGFGWYVNDTDRGTRRAAHGGATGGYRAQLTRYLDENALIVVLSNDRGDIDTIESKLARLLFPDTRATMAADLYLSRTRPDDTGTVRLDGRCRWLVMPRYVGTGADGAQLVDDRTTLALMDPRTRMWIGLTRMGGAIARELAADLQRTLAETIDREDPSNGAMDVLIRVMPKMVDRNLHVPMDPATRWRVLPSPPEAADQQDRPARITMVLDADGSGETGVYVTMDRDVAESLLAELGQLLD